MAEMSARNSVWQLLVVRRVVGFAVHKEQIVIGYN